MGPALAEWTLEEARKHWKPMVRPVQHVGLPGYQFQAGVLWDGSLVFGPLSFRGLGVKELRHFPETNRAPGETCWKLERTWFWKERARSGSAKGVMGNMAKAHARNSNFLLNVGPDRRGNIVESSIKTLAEIGKLMRKRTPPGNASSTEPVAGEK